MQRQPAVSVEVHSSVLQMSKILKIGHKQWQCATLFHSLLCSFYLHATNEPSINGGIVLSPMSTSVKWVVALSLFLLPSSFLPILNFIFSIARCSLVCDCNTWWKGKQTRKKRQIFIFSLSLLLLVCSKWLFNWNSFYIVCNEFDLCFHLGYECFTRASTIRDGHSQFVNGIEFSTPRGWSGCATL